MFKFILATALVTSTLAAHAFDFSSGFGRAFGQLATQTNAQGTEQSVDEVLQQLSAEKNQTLPRTVDQYTRLDRVSTQPGRHYIYHFTRLGQPLASDAAIDFSKTVKPQLKSQLCSNTENRKFLKNGVIISYQYQDQSGRAIGGAEFSPGDCDFKT